MADLNKPPLNLRPQGILDYFGIKNGGWGPRTFNDELVPTIDLWRHYVANNSIDADLLFTIVPPISTSSVANDLVFQAPNAAIPATVPPGETWYIDSATAVVNITGAGATSRVTTLGISGTQSGVGNLFLLPIAPLTPTSKAAGVPLGMETPLLYPVWLKPGQKLQSIFGGVVDAADAAEIRLFMRFVRMRI